LICSGSLPVKVPHDIVDGLKQRSDEDGCLAHPEVVTIGGFAEVTQGPFAGFVGRIERLAPAERAMVLIELLTKQTRVSVLKSHVRPLPRSTGS
jgi:transcriptional antiterminator RfaH